MRRSAGVMGVLAVLLGLGASVAWSSGAASTAPAKSACGVRGHTLLSDSVARIYSLHEGVYGCSRKSSRSFRLGYTRICVGRPRVDRFALAADTVAYGFDQCGVDTGSTFVAVRRLTDGRRLHLDPATSQDEVEGYGSLGSLVVKSDGSDAWIGVDTSIANGDKVIEVHEHDKHGNRLLDSSLDVAPKSLRLRASRLSWRDAGKTHTATLS